MQSLFDDLDNRKSELGHYLDLIDFLSASHTITNEKNETFQINTNLVKTTKGTVYLMLYNLIEATMREAVLAIHDKISANGSSFDNLRVELQKKILTRARKESIDLGKMLESMNGDISLKFHSSALKAKDLFSGNIDRTEIQKIATIYGFSDDTNYGQTKHGEHLKSVMTNRNDLAHGNKTFSNVGETKTAEDIRKLSNEVIAYIYEISDNIQDSVINKNYLKA
tara:strand:- start:805 stop:1476 length:672 start_codon:yes stop_codon:yes gene_type:complete